MVQIARALSAAGHTVALFVGGPRMSYLDGLDDIRATHLRWPTWLDNATAAAPEPVRDLGRRARRRRWLAALTALPAMATADVVHVQGLEDAEALLPAVDMPVVVTHWGRVGRWLPTGTAPAADRALAERIAQLRARATVVAIGQAQAEALAAAGLPAAAVIPPGIDLQHFRPGDRHLTRLQLGLPLGDGVVLYVGRLAPDKNVETLIQAFASLHQQLRSSRLLIVGDGPTKAQLQRLVEQLGVDTAVTFVPFIAHHLLPAYYNAADVTVVPSNYLETFCMVALEAIACACPLVVTDQVPEIRQAFPDVASLASYDVAGLRDQMAAALRGHLTPADNTRVIDYTWSNAARQYADLYQSTRRQGSGSISGR
ncbi:glycosyltransferase family 4 protein [Catellatospora sp. NPDC049111]|uniref:glycosyltransferase family 4 protein n=1 Tax=Catellatospora sp. NPDC049111 TaxID=3155271 RepID=UPI0033D8A759